MLMKRQRSLVGTAHRGAKSNSRLLAVFGRASELYTPSAAVPDLTICSYAAKEAKSGAEAQTYRLTQLHIAQLKATRRV